MKKFFTFLILVLPLSVFSQVTYTFDSGGNGYYDGTTWTNLSLYNGGSVGTANTVTTTTASTTLPSTVFHPLTYTSNISSADLTAIPSSSDCEVTWTQYINAVTDGTKSGIILRAQASAGYSTSARQGYYFMPQLNGSSGSVRFRIIAIGATAITVSEAYVTVSTSTTFLGPLYLKARVKGTALTFSYSTDKINWTVGTSGTSSAFTSGSAQLAWGYGGGSPIDAYIDDINFTNLDVLSAKLVGDDKYLYTGAAQGPSASTTAFFTSTPTVTYKYKGIGATTYDESVTAPSAVGKYIATVDATYNTQNAKDTLAYEIYTPNTENSYSYTFSDNVGSVPAGITYPVAATANGSGVGNVQSITGRIFPTASPYFTGYKTTGKMFVPTTGGKLAGTTVGNLTKIPSSSNYSLVWKEYYSAASSKKGFLLQGQADTCAYAVGLKKGYLFSVYNSGTNTELRIYTVVASGVGYPMTNNISVPVDPGVNVARWYRATVKPSVQTFEYSNDGVNWILATSLTDATYSGLPGITQSVAGFGSPLGTYGYDYIGYKDLSTSVNAAVANDKPLVLVLGAGSIDVKSGDFVIYNAQGLKIKEVRSNNSSNIINLHTGVYIVKSGVQVQKIIVQ